MPEFHIFLQLQHYEPSLAEPSNVGSSMTVTVKPLVYFKCLLFHSRKNNYFVSYHRFPAFELVESFAPSNMQYFSGRHISTSYPESAASAIFVKITTIPYLPNANCHCSVIRAQGHQDHLPSGHRAIHQFMSE